jgi:hypothetical protein
VAVLLRARGAPVDDPIVTVSLRRRTDGAIVLGLLDHGRPG